MERARAVVVTRLAPGPAGRPTVVKQGGVEAADRLRREADRLEAARHPGVVELLALRDEGGAVELVTAYAGPRTLADLMADGLAPDLAAHLVAQVASTLADVHARGVVHGAVAAEHVVVGGDDRAALCGWGEGPGDDGGGPWPADDVAGVGALLLAAADAADATGDADDAWHLRAVGQRAAAADPATRPSMRRIAADLVASAGAGAEHEGDDDGGTRVEPGGTASAGILRGRRPPAALERARGRPLRLAAGLVAVLAVATLGAAFLGGGRDPAPLEVVAPRPAPVAAPDGDVAGAEHPGTATATTAPTLGPPAAAPAEQLWPPPTVAPPTGDCAPSGDPAADVDGDGCPDDLVVAGGTVEAAGSRFEVGEPGDVVLVGDWDCDGAASAGVLRPATGEVFLFTGWDDATVGPTQVVAGAAGGVAVPDGPGCDALEVHDGAGAVTRVRA